MGGLNAGALSSAKPAAIAVQETRTSLPTFPMDKTKGSTDDRPGEGNGQQRGYRWTEANHLLHAASVCV